MGTFQQPGNSIKFAVGYQLREEETEESFVDIVRDYLPSIGEVYFAWDNMASGRAPMMSRRGYFNWAGREILLNDLAELKKMNVKLNLLFNANCHGQHAVSEHLQNLIISILDYLQQELSAPDIITTSSPVIAGIIKNYLPDIDVRASVNMRIGNIRGMEYVADVFDSYYVQREHNRNISYLSYLKKWATGKGKSIHILVNSGCLNYCSAQTFHDNAVAHEQEISETRNMEGAAPHICWKYYANPLNYSNLLQGSWIRPEDIKNYIGIFDVVKLATRMHSNPRHVIEAYASGRYRGNLLDLFEPGFSPLFRPRIIDNSLFPEDWFARTSTCLQNCNECSYCNNVLEKVLVEI